jgi:hypothetical protein
MRATWCALALSLTAAPAAAQQPLAEKYLHSGELAKGEQALEAALRAAPMNDQLRFGLGVIQFVSGVERLGQSLYEYGAKSESTDVPFLRLPVRKNPDPAPVRYHTLRRVLDDFRRDLAAADRTLAGVIDGKVKLPLRLAAVRLDLDGDGRPTDEFAGMLKTLMRQDLAFLKADPEFRVVFDRGDVAWLRAYCHLLMGMLDFMLAFDWEREFDQHTVQAFANPKPRNVAKDRGNAIAVAEPGRLGRFRRHLLKVCELNRETWEFIRAETDDDREWLPNAKQKGVLGLPVRDEMIDAWLEMVAEMEALLSGEKVFPGLFAPTLRGISLKAVLDDPPAEFDFDAIQKRGVAAKYIGKGEAVDLSKLTRWAAVFNTPTAVAYAAWFN